MSSTAISNVTDGYLSTSAHKYRKAVDQNETAGDWLHHNTTEAYQFFQNTTTDEDEDEMTTDEDDVLLTIRIFMWILSPFILACNGLTIIVVMRFIKKVTPTHVVITFLALAGLFVGMNPLLNLIFFLIGNPKNSNDLKVWFFWAARNLSISAIMMVAVEHCFLVTSWKLYQKYWTVRRQIGLCIVFGVYSFIFATVFASIAEPKYDHRISEQVLSQKKVVFQTRFIFLPFFTLKTCVIAICYLTIMVFLWQHRKTVTSSQNSSSQQNFKKEKKTTVLIVVILTLYITGTFVPFVYHLMAQKYTKIWSLELFRLFSVI